MCAADRRVRRPIARKNAGSRSRASHLAEHVVAKNTTQDISALIGSRGGPDSYYALNIAAQRMSAQNPVRQAYEAEWAGMRADRDLELRRTTQDFRRRRERVTDPAELKSLRLEQRRAEKRIIDAYQPEDFGV